MIDALKYNIIKYKYNIICMTAHWIGKETQCASRRTKIFQASEQTPGSE